MGSPWTVRPGATASALGLFRGPLGVARKISVEPPPTELGQFATRSSRRCLGQELAPSGLGDKRPNVRGRTDKLGGDRNVGRRAYEARLRVKISDIRETTQITSRTTPRSNVSLGLAFDLVPVFLVGENPLEIGGELLKAMERRAEALFKRPGRLLQHDLPLACPVLDWSRFCGGCSPPRRLRLGLLCLPAFSSRRYSTLKGSHSSRTDRARRALGVDPLDLHSEQLHLRSRLLLGPTQDRRRLRLCLLTSAFGGLLRGLENRHCSIADSLENRRYSIADLDEALVRGIPVDGLVSVTHIYLPGPMAATLRVRQA
jgi:hypothetical protein